MEEGLVVEGALGRLRMMRATGFSVLSIPRETLLAVEERIGQAPGWTPVSGKKTPIGIGLPDDSEAWQSALLGGASHVTTQWETANPKKAWNAAMAGNGITAGGDAAHAIEDAVVAIQIQIIDIDALPYAALVARVQVDPARLNPVDSGSRLFFAFQAFRSWIEELATGAKARVVPSRPGIMQLEAIAEETLIERANEATSQVALLGQSASMVSPAIEMANKELWEILRFGHFTSTSIYRSHFWGVKNAYTVVGNLGQAAGHEQYNAAFLLNIVTELRAPIPSLYYVGAVAMTDVGRTLLLYSDVSPLLAPLLIRDWTLHRAHDVVAIHRQLAQLNELLADGEPEDASREFRSKLIPLGRRVGSVRIEIHSLRRFAGSRLNPEAAMSHQIGREVAVYLPYRLERRQIVPVPAYFGELLASTMRLIDRNERALADMEDEIQSLGGYLNAQAGFTLADATRRTNRLVVWLTVLTVILAALQFLL